MKKQRPRLSEAERRWALARGKHWDSHSLADVWDQTREADFDVDLRSESYVVALEPKLARALAKLANRKGVSPQTLLNLWVQEGLAKATS